MRAFHSAGLWLAVTATAPEAPASRAAKRIVGVGASPASTTSVPALTRPARAASESIRPEVRESRPR